MSWKLYKLGDILERKREKVALVANEDYKLVTIKLYHKGVVLRQEKKGNAIKSNMYRVNEGDFVLSGIDARNGAFGIVPKELDNAIITNDFWCLEPNKDILRKDFFLFITSTSFFDYICNQCSDGTTQRIRLQREKFYNYKLSLPSIEEQTELVKQLTANKATNSKLSAELSHQLNLVTQLRQAFLREAMQGKLVEQNPTDEPASVLLKKIKAEKEQLIKDKKIKKQKPLSPITKEDLPADKAGIPDNWVWCRLGEVFNFIDYRGKTPTRTQEGVRLISAKNIRFGYIDNNPVEYIAESQYSKWMVRGFPSNGDILFVTEGHTMGFVAQLNLNFKYVLAQRTICLQPYNYDYPTCMYYFIMSSDFQKVIRQNATGAAATGIKSAKLKEMIISLPPLSEQKRIVAKLNELMEYCDSLEESIKNSQQQNEMLLGQVLREALEPKEKDIVV
jgi:type I restriction enzyme, S subunit